jgi:hypothetical protein
MKDFLAIKKQLFMYMYNTHTEETRDQTNKNKHKENFHHNPSNKEWELGASFEVL